MADQIPIKVMKDGSDNTCGLAQFTSSDSVAVAAGGTGLTSQGICAFAQPGIQAVACKTTYIGICAGKSEGAADENTYVGYGAGQNVTTGCYHTIIGSNAGDAITTCSGSVLIGYNAGTAITFGDRNTAIGTSAGAAITTATDNTLVGYISGCVTTGNNNTGLGACALALNTVGVDNVVIGSLAGKTQVAAGCNNTYIGSQAGEVALCRDNTLVGAYAGTAQTTATCNVMLGGCVGYGVVGGAGNVYLGYKSGLVNTSGNDNVFIGKASGVASTASCCLIIGNGTCDIIVGNFDVPRVGMVGCVGIGTLAPAAPLQVYGMSRFSRTDSTPAGTANTVMDDAVFGSTDTANTGITLLGTGQVGIAFGDAASTEIGQIRYQHSTNAMEFRTNGAEAMMIDNAGCVGIGTTAPDGTLHVFTATAGSVTAYAYANQLVLENSDDGGLSILGPDANRQQIYFGSPSDNGGAIMRWVHNDSLMTIGTAKTGAKIAFATDDLAEAMRITSAGNVGIGTTTPCGKLQIVTGAEMGITIRNTDQSTIGATPHMWLGSASAIGNLAQIAFGYDNSGVYGIQPAASMGYVTQSASGYTMGALFFATSGATTNTAPSERMRITYDGKVGIGTTAPAKILSVYGALDTTNGTDPVARFERTGASHTGITVRSNDIDGLILRAESAGLGSVHGNTDLAFYTGATPGSDYGTKNWIMLDNLP